MGNDIRIRWFTTVSSGITEDCKQPKCSSIRHRLNKLENIHTMGYLLFGYRGERGRSPSTDMRSSPRHMIFVKQQMQNSVCGMCHHLCQEQLNQHYMLLLGWPKSSFGFFSNMFWKNPKQTFCPTQHCLYKETIRTHIKHIYRSYLGGMSGEIRWMVDKDVKKTFWTFLCLIHVTILIHVTFPN